MEFAQHGENIVLVQFSPSGLQRPMKKKENVNNQYQCLIAICLINPLNYEFFEGFLHLKINVNYRLTLDVDVV